LCKNIPVTIPIIVATKKCNIKPTSGCDEFTIFAITNNITVYDESPSMSKNILGKCIVNAPIMDPIATKNTSFLNEKFTIGCM
jgi:hypothetical protein